MRWNGQSLEEKHSFDITLMNEFSMEENIEMARAFVREELVSRGMIADFAIHDPVRSKGAEPNPHLSSNPSFEGRWNLGDKRKEDTGDG